MPCDVDFLPSHIIELMNLLTSVEPYTGSARPSRLAMYPFRGIVVSISFEADCLPGANQQIFFKMADNHPPTTDDVFYALGRFAPYLERLCLRPATPTASSVPRTT